MRRRLLLDEHLVGLDREPFRTRLGDRAAHEHPSAVADREALAGADPGDGHRVPCFVARELDDGAGREFEQVERLVEVEVAHRGAVLPEEPIAQAREDALLEVAELGRRRLLRRRELLHEVAFLR